MKCEVTIAPLLVYFYISYIYYMHHALCLLCIYIMIMMMVTDELEIKPTLGEVKNLLTGIRLKSAPLSEIVLEILNSGGYFPYTRKKLTMK